MRLPGGTFDGTEVVSDLLVLRRPDGAEIEAWAIPTVVEDRPTYTRWGRAWESVRIPERVELDEHATVSALWRDHPEAVAGVMEPTGFNRSPLRVRGSAEDLTASLEVLRNRIPASPQPVAEDAWLADITLDDGEGRKEGSFHVVDGSVHRVTGGKLEPVARAPKELLKLIPLRDAATRLIDLESQPHLPDEEVIDARREALRLYDEYVAAHGPIGRGTLTEGKPDPETGEPTYTWRRPPLGGFRKDPDFALVLALEHYDTDTGQAGPAPILLGRVNRPPAPLEAADSLSHALSITLGESLHVDVDRVGQLLGITGEEATRQLIDERLAFMDPDVGAMVDASRYLSGDIRAKLERAEAEGMDENAEALRGVLPRQLGPSEIRPQLGAPWIRAKDIEEFAAEVLGQRIPVSYLPEIGAWSADIPTYSRYSPEASASFGTSRFNPGQLLAAGLSQKPPVAYDEAWDGERYRKVRNSNETVAAEEALSRMQQRFAVWVWEDSERSQRLCDEYNRRFRSHVAQKGDAPTDLILPGLSEDVNLWPHQRSAVWRILTTDRVILNHPVGAGKTLEAIVGAMKLRQLGLARKPLIVVPNHLLEQIAREARMAYPTGRFLIAGKEDLARDSRRVFAARCATGDWDAVVMTHQAFGSISMPSHVEAEWIEEEKAS